MYLIEEHSRGRIFIEKFRFIDGFRTSEDDLAITMLRLERQK